MNGGRYRLTGRLEVGELAELYKGTRDAAESVVLKLFLPQNSDEAYARNLAETARRLAPVPDPAILDVLELGLVKGRLAVVRQWVDGYTLGTALQRLSTKEVLLPLPIALHIVIQLLECVQRAHEVGVIHGAITPGNILLSNEGAIAIGDFGAIRALAASPALKAFLGKGRSAYRAVEVVQGEEPTAASDVYSLGAIAYELLTLREAMGGATAVSTRRDALPPPPSRLDRRINTRLDAIVMRAIDPHPNRRFKSCAEAASALRGFLATLGGMPTAEDVKRFVVDLFPNEVTFQPGAVPFSEEFTLKEVKGTALKAVGENVHTRVAFSPRAPELAAEDSVSDTQQATPAFESYPGDDAFHKYDDGTDPGSAGPLEKGWVAPPGAAPAKPRPQAAAAPAGAMKGRVRVVEDFEALPPPEAQARTTLVTDPAPPPAVTAPRPKRINESLADPSFRPLTTGERWVKNWRLRSRKMGVIAALVASVGLASFLLALVHRVHTRRRPHPPVAEAIPPPLPEPPPVPRVTELARPAPSDGDQPVKLEPTRDAEPAPRHAGGAFLSISSNTPAIVYVDGVKHGHTPLKKVSIQPGNRKIAVESVVTGERKEFSMTFQKGELRKIEERFTVPSAHR